MKDKIMLQQQKITLPERKLHKNAGPIEGYINRDGCFICTSHNVKLGKYPQIKRDGRLWRLSRYMFYHYNEEIPEGEIIRHTCDNTLCINPEHLVKGTHRDNTNDRIMRGRQVMGSKHKNSKLNEDIVYYIKFISSETVKELSKKYKVSESTIRSIKANKTWKHVKEYNREEIAA